MDSSKIKGNVNGDAPVKSTRIRVGRSIEGFGLSPGITKEQRLEIENLMKSAFQKLEGDLAGTYYPLLGMKEEDRQQLVDDHFLFVSGDKNLITAGMERDWPEGRGIFHNEAKTFLVWVNEEDQLRIISMEKGGDVKKVFERLAAGIEAVQKSIEDESGKKFLLDESDSDEPEIIAEYEHEQIIEDVKTAPETAQAQDSSSSSSDCESENVEKEIVSEENLMETIESFQKSNLKTVETVVKASLPDQDDVAQEKEVIEAETEQNKEF